jgi:hypothetical protein
MNRLRLLASSFTAALLLAACGGGDTTPTVLRTNTPLNQLALKAFAANCSDFLDYAADGLTEEYLHQFHCLAVDGICPVYLGAPQGAEAPGQGQVDSGPGRVSTTNTQEAGVDEADIVKADSAGRLYIVSGTKLTLLEAFPPQALADRPLTVVDLTAGDPSFSASDLFLDEARDRVVVLGYSFDGQRSVATSVLIDVSDPAAPHETGRLSVEGYPLEARRVGARVHRVSRFDVPRPAWFYEANDPLQTQRQAYLQARSEGREAEAESLKAEVREEIGERIADAGAPSLLPRTFRQQPGQARTEAALGCGDLSHPEVSTGLGMALVDSFNVDGTARGTSGVINNAYLVYASETNLYLAQPSAGWFFAPAQADETAIYRLALSSTGAPAYQALAKVSGTVHGAYALSEHEGFLRVASTTTTFDEEGAETSNGLTILDATATGTMPVAGSLAGLAPGERIQGARLLGDRGFLSTFRQVDPLFALDLSDPQAPQVKSETIIPGFSSYLTPLGDDFLLTVGRAGTNDGLNGAVAVQLFDVSDLANVRSAATLSPAVGGSGYSYSVAEYDPHAFAYFPDSATAPTPGTLAIPVTAWGDGPQAAFTGFVVIRVAPGTAQPLSELGRIDHDQFLEGQQFCEAGDGSYCFDAYWLAEPRRAVYMQSGADTFLYTISAVGVLANDAHDPAVNVGAHSLPYDPSCCGRVLDAGTTAGVGS